MLTTHLSNSRGTSVYHQARLLVFRLEDIKRHAEVSHAVPHVLERRPVVTRRKRLENVQSGELKTVMDARHPRAAIAFGLPKLVVQV